MKHPYKVQVDATRLPPDGERYDGFWEVLNYEHDDADISIRFAASAAQPVLVKEVINVVTVAFGAGATIAVGDGSTANSWLATGDVAQNTAGSVASSLVATTPRAGVLHTAPGTIKVTVGGTHSAGKGKLLAYLIRL